jgi:hypothetical protein
MVRLTVKGNFNNTERFFNNSQKISQKFRNIMEKYGQRGVDALRSATPKDTGETSASWTYSIQAWGISWNNTYIIDGVPIALIIQYGHGTRNGGYVQGRDYINPAIRPIFDAIAEECWKEVENL